MGLWDRFKETVSDASERTVNFVTGGRNDRKKSERIVRWANEQKEEVEARLATAKAQSAESLQRLGELRISIYDTTVQEFLRLYDLIGAIKSQGLQEINRSLALDSQLTQVQQLRVVSEHVQEMLTGSGAGVMGGATLALGAWGLAGTLGTASTGTAIGTLSGAAATNATLAWLGGGAASAGGLGMAGGVAVLGGAVLIPTALVAMYFGQNDARKKLNEAHNYSDDVDAWDAQVSSVVSQLEHTRKASEMMQEVMQSLDAVVAVQNSRMLRRLEEVAASSHDLHQHISHPLTASPEAMDRLERQVAAISYSTI